MKLTFPENVCLPPLPCPFILLPYKMKTLSKEIIGLSNRFLVVPVWHFCRPYSG
jgi:hypothetical protein